MSRKFGFIISENSDFTNFESYLLDKLNIEKKDIHIFSVDFNGEKKDILNNLDCEKHFFNFGEWTKLRNSAVKFFKEDLKFNGFLHLISPELCICKPIDEFLNSIENLMDILDYNTWLNTITDKCNFVYNQYNPRLVINNDDPKFKDLTLTKKFCFTSHCNINWSIINLAKEEEKNLYFDEEFKIPMYYIIEFLARRHTFKSENDFYYMNNYPTVNEEFGCFKMKQLKPKSEEDLRLEQKKIDKEGKIFFKKKLNYNPDNDLNALIFNFYKKLTSRLTQRKEDEIFKENNVEIAS